MTRRLLRGVQVPVDFWLDASQSFDLLGWAAAILEDS